MANILFCIYLCITVTFGQVVLEGDHYVEGVFKIYTQDGSDCGESILLQSVQHVEAVKWALMSLNDENYFGNSKLGLRVHYTCGLVDRASQIAIKIIQNLSGEYNNTVAIVGPETSSEAIAMSSILSGLPEKDRILQLGYSTTAARLSDKNVYKNFFRVIASDDVQVKATVHFMDALKWTYFGVIYQDDAYGREAVETLTQINDELLHPLCLTKHHVIDKTFGQNESTQNIQNMFLEYQNDSYRIPGFLSICSEQLSKSVLDAVINLQSKNMSKDFRPVMLFAESFPVASASDVRYNNFTKGIYLLSPPTRQIEDFKVYWEKLLNNETNGTQFFNDFIVLTNDPESLPSLRVQNLYTDYVVQAIITVAKVVKDVTRSACGKSCSKGDFVNHMGNLKVALDSFDVVAKTYSDFNLFFPDGSSDAVKSEGLPSYVVYNRRICKKTNSKEFCFEKIFEYFDSSDTYNVDLENIRDYYFFGDREKESIYPNVRKAQCPDGMNCIENMCPPISVQDIEVIEGSETGSDMYVVGLVPVHTMSDTPLKCGPIKKGGFDVAEAIKYEVKNGSNEYKSKIPNARIGVIIIDSCNDPQIVSSRILQLHSKGIFENGKFRQIKDKILGYIGGWVSDVTLTAASALTRLGYAQVCYASSSPLLSDRVLYPYFMRVVSSDITQAKRMLSAVEIIGSNLVQVLYSKTAYGTGGMEAIRDFASEYGICIANIVGVEQVEDIDKEEIKRRLTLPNNPKVIMVFLSSFDLVKLISTLDSMKDYMFLASEAWGNRDIISNTKNLHGTITTAYELKVNDRFVDHLKTLDPYEKNSPWLAEYLEKYFNCYFEWSFDKSAAPRKCNNTDRLVNICLQVDPIEKCFKIETWAPFSNFAVEALLRGSKITLQELCNTTEKICDEYRKSPKRLVENIHPLKFSWNSLNPSEMFDENNDGLIDFNWYQIDMSTGRAEYVRINFNDIEEVKTLRSNVWSRFQSSCSKMDHHACQKCFKIHVTKMEEETKLTTVFVIILAIVSFILASVLVVTFVLWKCRPRSCRREEGNTNDDTYLRPVTDDGYLNNNELNPKIPERRKKLDNENPYVSHVYPDDMYLSFDDVSSPAVPQRETITARI